MKRFSAKIEPYCEKRIKARIKAELSALNLMSDMLGKDFVDKFLQKGYIIIKGLDGKGYKIDMDGAVHSLPEERFVCLQAGTEEDLPRFDEILAKYLFLKGSPDDVLKHALGEMDCWQEEGDNENNDEYDYEVLPNGDIEIHCCCGYDFLAEQPTIFNFRYECPRCERIFSLDPRRNIEDENEARKNASYDLDIDGRIIALSLEEQDERVN